HWNGSAWSTQRTPIPSGSGGLLAGITCTSAAACTAVGGTFNAHGERTLAERWDGTSWSVQRIPSEPPPQDNELAAVSCPSLSSRPSSAGRAVGRHLVVVPAGACPGRHHPQLFPGRVVHLRHCLHRGGAL